MMHCGEYMYFKTRTWASLAESYVVIFIGKWVLANQRSERCFSRLKTTKHPIRIANSVLSRERKMIGAIKKPLTEVCVFRAKISAFYRRLQLAAPSLFELLCRHSTNKDLLRKFFFAFEKWKTSRKLQVDWNIFLDCTIDEENYSGDYIGVNT